MIQVSNLLKIFKDERSERVLAVDEVSFEVPVGHFFTLLGPSGCGKTTLLRLIAGLEKPEQGEIWIGGQLVCSAKRRLSLPPNERSIGMVFQSYAIWPHMTVYENVAFPLKVLSKRLDRREIRKRVEGALATVQLEGLQDRPAPYLSGGQQQRLALARALVREPKILLLDEPLSNLDAKLREQLRFELRQLQRRLGITTIYVTHDQAEALAMSDTVAVMSQGKIVQTGRPREIYDHPFSQFTASFIGSTNFLPGNVVDGVSENGYRCVLTEQGLISCHVPEEIQAGKPVLISIRPQHILAAQESAHPAINVLVGILKEEAFMGEYLDCQVEVGSKMLRVFFPPSSQFLCGDKVYLHLPENRCIVVPHYADSELVHPSSNDLGLY